jgi:hypothetical protein
LDKNEGSVTTGATPDWFTCTAQEKCLMLVTFDPAYDIVWLEPRK